MLLCHIHVPDQLLMRPLTVSEGNSYPFSTLICFFIIFFFISYEIDPMINNCPDLKLSSSWYETILMIWSFLHRLKLSSWYKAVVMIWSCPYNLKVCLWSEVKLTLDCYHKNCTTFFLIEETMLTLLMIINVMLASLTIVEVGMTLKSLLLGWHCL